MSVRKENSIEEEWVSESKSQMEGWNFEHLNGRCFEEEPPWNYKESVSQYLYQDTEWLDIDTGGGELMRSFRHSASKTSVTEGWEPNLALLKRTVVPSGVKLYSDTNECLQGIQSSSFDLVTNSHGALPISRIAQVLKPGGVFVTEQVGATNNFSLSRFLSDEYRPAYPDNNLISVLVNLQKQHLDIIKCDSAHTKLTFTDVGAIVYYATVIPWEFPKFDVHQAMSRLHSLQKIINTCGSVTTFEERFFIIASKPK